MSAGVLALVLAAAFAHAGWNFLAKGAEGGARFVWLCAAVGSLIWIPVLAVVVAIDAGELGWVALGLMVGRGLLHALYFTLLQRGYAAGDLSLVLTPVVLRVGTVPRGELRRAAPASGRCWGRRCSARATRGGG